MDLKKEKKSRYNYTLPPRTHTGWKRKDEGDSPCKGKPVGIRGAMLITAKMNFKPKTVLKNKENHYIMIKDKTCLLYTSDAADDPRVV